MIPLDLTLDSWAASWRFHPDAGTFKHGPTLDKPQTKVWFALGSWWALLVRSDEAAQPEMAICELVEGDKRWRDAGTLVTSTPLATADAHFDGESVWIATRAPGTGVSLQRFHLDVATRSWTPDPAGRWTAPDVDCVSVSVARGNDGSIWVTYVEDSVPWFATCSVEHFPDVRAPQPVPGAAASLWNVDISALVAMDDSMGLFWSDQGQEAFYFALASPDGEWRTETAAIGGLVSDDHIAIRQLDGRLYIAVKTSKDGDPASGDDPLILLLVREPDGAWHEHPVVSVSEPVTRPMPLLDPPGERIFVLYTYGPNPGERTIRIKGASLEKLEFEPGPGDVVMGDLGAQLNDVTGPREHLLGDRGAVVLASDGADRRYYFCRLTRA